MRAITAAASAGMSTVGPLAMPGVTPDDGAFRMTASVERPPAIIHTIVDSRRIGMPNSSARSAFSADARTATPASVRSRNQLRARMTSGTVRMITASSSASAARRGRSRT